MHTFDDATIQQIFGADDAENEDDERLKEYFYRNMAYDSLTSNLPVRVLVGHKGVGKSALLKRAYLSDVEAHIPCVWLQPDALLNVQTDTNPNDQFVRKISVWKTGILREILGALFEKAMLNQLPELENASANSLAELIVKWLDEKRLENGDVRSINIYIDDIDRGWKANPEDITNISALLNAIRDIGGKHPRIRFRIGLRSDVYFLVRTSDESTDKIEGNVIWLRWINDDILRVIAKRIATFFKLEYTQQAIDKLDQGQITSLILKEVIEPRFSGKGKWEDRPVHKILLSLTRARPRDLVKLFRLAAKSANKRGASIISSQDLNGIFEMYSQERLQDIINEFKSELPQIERLLLAMKPTKMERRTATSYTFTTDQLSRKLTNIIQQNNFTFTNGKAVSSRALIQFLYKIDFITARKVESDGNIVRKYFEESRFLGHEIVDFGYGWEIHPAYRWALQPENVNAILDALEL
ncbi:P-loop ATPase, Sll1717 family [Ciceribacter ferrooxidans]|uniref:Uncharacterized protein n=1 Tax=Ciceribacter ferrooxidans TaxID=2509717 RepID=A0A4Q2TD86_9HYPH|nr:ATP-binding protein [Ciceribacter ferrooxidans]RYC15235.1 hypothetical protein EUU22_09355 [Ciceribacter ferrooxidans]